MKEPLNVISKTHLLKQIDRPLLSEIKTGQREVKLVGMSKFLNCL
jgi:hypothetical protein